MTQPEGRSAFFYGTLMVPQVLHRVCHGGMQPDNAIYFSHKLHTFPAILHHYRRAKVHKADYPGITPNRGSSVRGTLVTGLTDSDIWRLDSFEGDEYSRQKVTVHKLIVVGNDAGHGNVEGDEFEAETYVFKPEVSWRLLDAEWDFDEFKRANLSNWIIEDEGFAGTSGPH